MEMETGIKWTDSRPERFAALAFPAVPDAVSLEVQTRVACSAQCGSVGDVETNFGMICEALNVVSLEVPAAIVAASRAGESIPTENRSAPLSIFRRAPRILASLGSTTFPRIMVAASLDVRTGAQRHAYPPAKLGRALLALIRPWFPLVDRRNLCTSFRAMCPALKGAYPALCVHADRHSIACEAFRLATVVSGSVLCVFTDRLPRLAYATSLHSARAKMQVFIEADTSHFGSRLSCPFRSLSHG